MRMGSIWCLMIMIFSNFNVMSSIDTVMSTRIFSIGFAHYSCAFPSSGKTSRCLGMSAPDWNPCIRCVIGYHQLPIWERSPVFFFQYPVHLIESRNMTICLGFCLKIMGTRHIGTSTTPKHFCSIHPRTQALQSNPAPKHRLPFLDARNLNDVYFASWHAMKSYISTAGQASGRGGCAHAGRNGSFDASWVNLVSNIPPSWICAVCQILRRIKWETS